MRVLPRINKSLCGCSLETGTKIIGWLQLIGCIIILLALLNLYPKAKEMSKERGEQYEETLIFRGVLVSIYIIFVSLLLVGVYRERPSFIFAWMVFEGVTIICTFIYNIALLIILLHSGIIIQGASSCAFYYYSLAVVYAHYLELKSRRTGA